MRNQLPLERAPVPPETARDLRGALRLLVDHDHYRKANTLAIRVKEQIAPTKNLYNRATGTTINQMPRDERSRKQIPTRSSL